MKRIALDEKVVLMMNESQAIQCLEIIKYEWWTEALHGIARNGTATVFNVNINLINENLEWWDAVSNTVHECQGDYQLMVSTSSKDVDLSTIQLNIQYLIARIVHVIHIKNSTDIVMDNITYPLSGN